MMKYKAIMKIKKKNNKKRCWHFDRERVKPSQKILSN